MVVATANSVMRDLWINLIEGSGQEITLERNYLYFLLQKLEKEQYDNGYADGYENRGLVAHDELPSDTDYKGINVKW